MTVSVADRVIIVTGAGRGLGRAYAHDLAARGAKVVVNDLGASVDGQGRDANVADTVVQEIEAAGGKAVAHCEDAASPTGVAGLVDTALRSFGGVDGCVVNAGIIKPGIDFPDIDESLLERLISTHLYGAWRLARAVWPHFTAQRRGRLMFVTSSAGLYGMPGNAGYALTKAAVFGLTRTLAAEGAQWGILVNAVSPHAWSRMAGDVEAHDEEISALRQMVPLSGVAPIAACLMSDEVPFNGQVLSVGGGHVGRVFVGETLGIEVDRERWDPGLIVDQWASINNVSGAVVADDNMDAFRALIAEPKARAVSAE
jgi:NAD(P)-dependent dehydrogenase (short-subunit alcohol dehydrogenase family)